MKQNTMGFKCPICGGYKFGTTNMVKEFPEWVGHCHGSDHSGGCGFKWLRVDDVKYGLSD